MSNLPVGDKVVDQNDGRRRSGRRSLSPIVARRLDNDVPSPDKKRLRTSPRFLFDTCCDINNLPLKLRCFGCVHFDDFGTKPRGEYTSRKYQCYKAWERDEKTIENRMQPHYNGVIDFIEKQMQIDPAALKKPAVTPKPMPKPTTNDNDVTPSPPPVPQVELITTTIRSNGQEFTFHIPSSHRIVHKDHLKRWHNDSRKLQHVRAKIQSLQYSTNSIFVQSLWAIAYTSVPALALSAAQHLFPLLLYAFFYDTGLMNNLNHNLYAKSFPCDATLRKCNLMQATRDTMVLGNNLRNKKIYVGCDKGNKKGVGHFIKVLSSLDDHGIVQAQLLDIDASGGTSADCAAAIRASMNKLKVHDDDDTHLLYGTGTDSGGGGVLESLHNHMKQLGLCAPDEEYLVANCCIHSLQVQLSNAVKETFGEGKIDRVNAMQLLHSVWRLQESLDLDEWRHVLYKSSQWVASYTPDVVVEETEQGTEQQPTGQQETEHAAAGSDNNNNKKKKRKKKKKKKKKSSNSRQNEGVFRSEFATVYSFHSKFKKTTVEPTAIEKGSLLGKMQAPILSRWWTVGTASSHVFDYYLMLFHACQTIVNMCGSSMTPNIIASGLFATMKDQETFIDLVLIRCFHKAYINPHFDWLQSCDDLSGCLGFSAHQMAVRFYVMQRHFRDMMSRRSFPDYHEAVANWTSDNDEETRSERQRHINKLNLFIKTARDFLFKHFPRWLNRSLLPAAMLAEHPMARVVAAVVLGKSFPTFESDASVQCEIGSRRHLFQSSVHKERIDLEQMYKFFCSQLENMDDNDGVYTPESLVAAEMLYSGSFDMRRKDYQSEYGELRWHMHSTYLPLPSQTQYVESFVKDAANVSQTDRSEAHRSWCSIIRSASPLTRTEKDANANRIKGLIDSAFQRSDPHVKWRRNQGPDYEYEQRLNTISYSLSNAGHFKSERIDSKKAKVDDKGVKCKRQNVSQQTRKQCKTAAVTGLIPCGKLVKARNMLDLEEELLFRGVPMDAVPVGVTDRKDMLKQLEVERLMMDCGVSETDAVAHKEFKKLSNAPFKLSD